MSNVRVLPVWKQNATVVERVQEICQMVEHQPERFKNFVFVYETRDEFEECFGSVQSSGLTTREFVYMLTEALHHSFHD